MVPRLFVFLQYHMQFYFMLNNFQILAPKLPMEFAKMDFHFHQLEHIQCQQYLNQTVD